MSSFSVRGLALLTVGFTLLTACDYSGDFLFPGEVEGVPGVVDLGTQFPAEWIEDGSGSPAERNALRRAVEERTIYGEVGPNPAATLGGVTLDFVGTGSSVCVWVDPELVSWNQSVAANRPTGRWTYPDNVFDDGDLDVFAGLSVFYTGAPGESIGDFVLELEDDLGNTVPVSLSECNFVGFSNAPDGHPGRGQPEYCTINNTQPGVSYTVVLQAWSTPLDDDRLGYGVALLEGRCEDIRGLLNVGDLRANECLITGESIVPNEGGNRTGATAAEEGLPPNTWRGLPDEPPAWDGSVEFEETFCSSRIDEYCLTEEALVADADEVCDWFNAEGTRCYCGNFDDTPSPGAF